MPVGMAHPQSGSEQYPTQANDPSCKFYFALVFCETIVKFPIVVRNFLNCHPTDVLATL